MNYDFAIIGAGLIGTAIARELAKYDVKTVVIEKLSDVATETSKANSGIIHAGYAAPSGTLKAKFNVEGNPLFDEICKELYVPFERIGSFVVGISGDNFDYIEREYQNGIERGIPGLEIIKNIELIKKMEPRISDDVEMVLHAPSAGIISPFGLAIALAESATINGVDFFYNSPVQNIELIGKFFIIDTPNHSFQANAIINAAGLFADDIAMMVGDFSFSISPRKGEYMLLDKMEGFINHILFPVPTKKSKGILVSPTIDGNIFLGPNAKDQESKLDNSTTIQGLEEVINGGRKLVPSIPLKETITNFAGLRAVSNTNDFIIEESKVMPNFFHAAGIQSPGLSSCLAIAKEVIKNIKNSGFDLKLKETFHCSREKPIIFKKLTWMEKDSLIKKDKAYGHIV
ncbi:MAG: NAD(P)/FAD-dependent oxidoreductase, partial [Promethearchaeota archaeon]